MSFKSIILETENNFLRNFLYTKTSTPFGDIVVERNGSDYVCHPFHPATVYKWSAAPSTKGTRFYKNDPETPTYYIDIDWFNGAEILNKLAIIQGMLICMFKAMKINLDEDNVLDQAALDAATAAYIDCYVTDSFSVIDIINEYRKCYLGRFVRNRKDTKALVSEAIYNRAMHGLEFFQHANEKFSEEIGKQADQFEDQFTFDFFCIAQALLDLRLDKIGQASKEVSDTITSTSGDIIQFADMIDDIIKPVDENPEAKEDPDMEIIDIKEE